MSVRWVSVHEVAVLLKVHVKTVRRWCVEGHVDSRVDGPRLRYVKVHSGGELDGRPVGLDEERD